jgi:chorismate mutase
MGSDTTAATPSLEEVRWRLDAIDTELLKLLDERASLAGAVAAAKRASGDTGFGLRPGREAHIVRKLLEKPRRGASDALVIRIWREIMADNLARQGPYHLGVFGGRDPARAVELTRLRFGTAPRLSIAATAQDALAIARSPWGVGVLPLASDTPWWGRLLAEPKLKVFAALPCRGRGRADRPRSDLLGHRLDQERLGHRRDAEPDRSRRRADRRGRRPQTVLAVRLLPAR